MGGSHQRANVLTAGFDDGKAGNAGVIAEGTIVESPAVQADDGFASDIWAVTGFVVSH